MDLQSLSDFNVVALHGGFSEASRKTGRPKASLSRRVRELEEFLKVALVDRGAKPFRLTDEGVRFHEETRAMLDRIDDIATEFASTAEHPRGSLRVSAPMLFAHRGIGKMAARFARSYPDVQLEIVVDDRFVDAFKDGFDLVIRANPEPNTELAGRCLRRDRAVIVAAPSIPVPKDGEGFPAIFLSAARAQRTWHIDTEEGVLVTHPREVLCLSSLPMIWDAVREGLGAAILPASLVRDDIREGRLVRWGERVGRPIEVWALYPEQRRGSPKVVAFLDMLVEEFSTHHVADPSSTETRSGP